LYSSVSEVVLYETFSCHVLEESANKFNLFLNFKRAAPEASWWASGALGCWQPGGYIHSWTQDGNNDKILFTQYRKQGNEIVFGYICSRIALSITHDQYPFKWIHRSVSKACDSKQTLCHIVTT
jgi:hypothetical protein